MSSDNTEFPRRTNRDTTNASRRAVLRSTGAFAALPALSGVAASMNETEGDERNYDAKRGTTAWRGGEFAIDARAVVERSDIVLETPPLEPEWSMGVGNGRVGAAVWAADGFAAQLNPNHTVGVEWKSAGQLRIDGLEDLADADDYGGRVALYDGVFEQSGNGTTVETYVHATNDENLYVVDIDGVDPDSELTVSLELEDDRDPEITTTETVAAYTETWEDEGDDRFVGEPDEEDWTWSLAAALTTDGRERTAEQVDETTIAVHCRPDEDGALRVFVSLPPYPGDEVEAAKDDAIDAVEDATEQSASSLRSAHEAWWHEFWEQANLLRLESDDGAAAFYENARALNLYYQASMNRGVVPGHHAGEGHLFRYQGDHIDWLGFSNGYWHFNVRLQVLASFAAGITDLNEPLFRLYRENIDERKEVTSAEMEAARDQSENVGAAIPEVMTQAGDGDWQLTGDPWFTGRINSSGGELTHLIWDHYRYTQDDAFLEEQFPVMAETTRFMLAYAREDDDGVLYTEPSNAHETQWDTRNPSTDVAVMKSTFPLVADLADRFDDDGLAADLEEAIPKIPEFPRDDDGTIAWSELDLEWENTVNVDLEPIYPWGLFDDAGDDDTELARSTFENRTFILGGNVEDHPPKAWTLEPAQAARLGMTDAFQSLLWDSAQAFHAYQSDGSLPSGLPSGMIAQTQGNPYVEWLGAHTCALQEAAVQSHDGLIRICPSWPTEWDGDVELDVVGNHRVVTQIRDGVPQYVGMQAGEDDELRIRNPWPDRRVRVVDGAARSHGNGGGSAAPIVGPTDDEVLEFEVEAGDSYVLERIDAPLPSYGFEEVTGERNQSPRLVGDAQIGLPSVLELIPSRPQVTDMDPGETATLRLDVENAGTTTSDPIDVRLLDATDEGAEPIDDIELPRIPPESSESVTYAWDVDGFELGTIRDVRAVVDPDDEHGQRSESESTAVRLYHPLPEEYESFASTDAVFGTWDDQLVISANGEEVWSAADEYGALYRPDEPAEGDVVATVEVTSQEDTSDWANAGVLIRNDVTANGESTGYAHISATPRHGFMFEWDDSGDGYVNDRETAGDPTYPCWLRLEKEGETITGSYSTDGESWSEVGSADVPGIEETQDVALFTTSANDEELSTAMFDSFEYGSS